MYDVIIIGAGAAGLAAGMYTARRALSTLVVSSDLGGQAAMTDWIENYPGIVGKTHGVEIMEHFKTQYVEFGGTLQFATVERVVLEGEHFKVVTSSGDEEAQAVILAFGLSPRELKVPGEKELKGKGVTYCATCDGPLFKGKTVGVVGSATEALDAAEYLSRLCPKVYLFPQRDKLLGSTVLNEKVKGMSNVEIVWNKKITAVKGEGQIEGVAWQDVSSEEKGETALQGLFVEIGYLAKTDWVKDTVALNARRQIIVDKQNKTNVPGIFAAGDVTDIDYKQVVISAGEGAKAALEAYKYLQEKQGKRPVLTPDWGGRD